jgi:hypothetical protein
MGLGAKPPPQLGQTLPKTCSTHEAQKVHSKEQMRASVESGGNGLAQFSHMGRSASASMTSNSSSVMPYLRLISSLVVGIKFVAQAGGSSKAPRSTSNWRSTERWQCASSSQ